MDESVRVYAIQLLSKAAMMSSWLFIPVIADEFGIPYFEIGLIGVAYGLSMFLSYYLFGRLSDMMGRRKVFVELGFLVSSIAYASQLLMHDFVSMLLIQGFVGFSIGISSGPLVAYVSGFERYKREIGRMSGFGALGWGLGSIAAGLIGDYGLIFLMGAILSVAGLFISLGMGERRAEVVKVPLFPLELIKKNYSVYLAYFLRNLGAWGVWILFPIFLTKIGANEFWIGVIYAANELAQFPFMELVGRMSERVDERWIVRAGLILSAVAFTSFSFASWYVEAIPIQLVIAMSWSCLYVGSLIYLLERNVEKATSTGVLGSVISGSRALGPFFGGAVAQLTGMVWSMYIAAILAVAGLVVSSKL